MATDLTSRKQVLRKLVYGVYLCTVRDGDRAHASTVTWVAQASFEPPLIMMALRRDSRTWQLIQKNPAFGLLFLRSDQQDLAARFFRTPAQADMTLAGQPFRWGPTGVPVLDSVPAWLEGVMRASLLLGDHAVLVGEVVHVAVREPDFVPLCLQDTPWHYGG